MIAEAGVSGTGVVDGAGVGSVVNEAVESRLWCVYCVYCVLVFVFE
jgi:hypothetical protein